jgi:hypothetical protein
MDNKNFIIEICKYVKKIDLHGLDAINYVFTIILVIYNDYFSKIKNHRRINFCDLSSDEIYNTLIQSYGLVGFKNITGESIKDTINNFINDIPQNIDIRELENINNIIMTYFLDNDILTVIKNYFRYYNNNLLVEWIVNLANIKIINNKIESVLDGNINVNSFLDCIIDNANLQKINWSLNKRQLYGIQQNLIISNFIKMNLLLKTDGHITDNIINHDILVYDIKTPTQTFDIILFDLPTNIHNSIHALCCKKIKNLKLRGTKSEPLLLQFIMMTLNKNGRAIVIVPDSLLFSDSIQSIETRKYLLEHFNITKIIQIDEGFYKIKNIKKSIIYFENNGKTINIQFSKLLLNNNVISEEQIITIDTKIIKNNLYLLYYKLYIDTNIINTIEYNKVSNLFNFYNFNNKIENEDIYLLELNKYYKDINSINIIQYKECIPNINNIYINSNNNDIFYLKYLEYLIKTKYNIFVKGKMNQFDICKINDAVIPILPPNKKNAICNYLDFTNKIIYNNLEQITYYNNLKICLFDTLPTDLFCIISDICELYHSEEHSSYNRNSNEDIIRIIKNGSSAGTIYLINQLEPLQTNSYYLKLKDNAYLINYVYQYLKYSEEKIKKSAQLTPQPCVTKSLLLSLKIVNINLDNQEQIIMYCNNFDNNINKYELENIIIKEKNIISTVLKINKI